MCLCSRDFYAMGLHRSYVYGRYFTYTVYTSSRLLTSAVVWVPVLEPIILQYYIYGTMVVTWASPTDVNI